MLAAGARRGRAEARAPAPAGLASVCDQVPYADRWHHLIVVARQVAQIQNAGLSEFRIRDLSDEINKLLHEVEKSHWETRICELGALTTRAPGPRPRGVRGARQPRQPLIRGGACSSHSTPRKTRAKLIKDIDADYYGFLDNDGALVPREHQQKRCAVSPADWPTVAATRAQTCRAARPSPRRRRRTAATAATRSRPLRGAHAGADSVGGGGGAQALVERRKCELLARYAFQALRDGEDEARWLTEVAPARPELVGAASTKRTAAGRNIGNHWIYGEHRATFIFG